MIRASCIIPVRNRKDMVLEAIESVLAQAASGLEVIVVDDGSTDGSARQVKRHFPEVRLLETAKRIGPGPARNLGAEAARGTVLMFLDSDDTWIEDHPRLLLQAMDRTGFPAAYGITENVDMPKGSRFQIPEQGKGKEGFVFDELLRWCFLVPSAFAVTKKAFHDAGGFEACDLGEDWLFFLKLARFAPFAFVPEVVTLRSLHQGSLCCTAFSSGKAASLVKRLKALAHGCACSRETIRRMEKILHVTEKDGKKCRNVQEWYMSLKRHNLA